MLYILSALYIVIILLLLRVTVGKIVFETEYQAALKRGNTKKALFFGKLYYRFFGAGRNPRSIITNIERDLQIYKPGNSI